MRENKGKLEWHTETRKVNSLIPYQKNPRVISDKQMDQLKRSLTKFNLAEIPAINLDGKITAGHQRIMALQLLNRGEEEIEVRVPNRLLTEAEYKDYLLTSNRSGGTWDWEILKENFDIDFLLDAGFDSNDLVNIFDDAMEIEDDNFQLEKEIEKARKTDIKLGDMFALGRHRLICGDSTQPETVKKLVGNAKVDIVNNDIPYNIGLSYNAGIGGKRNYGGKTNDKKTDEEYWQFVKSILENSLSVCDENCHVFFWHDEKYTGMLQELYKESGVSQKRLCMWIKGNQNPTPQIAFNRTVELCMYGTRGSPFLSDRIKNLNEILNKEATTGNRLIEDIMDMFDIWLVKRLPSNEMEHPTQKPATLYEKSLRRCSKPGDVILDLTAGSGSLMVACEMLKRTAYLSDAEPIFCQVIINRYEKLTNKKARKIS